MVPAWVLGWGAWLNADSQISHAAATGGQKQVWNVLRGTAALRCFLLPFHVVWTREATGAQCCLSSLGRSLGHSAPAAGRGPLCGPGRGISKPGADATSACSAASPSRRPSTCPVWGAQRRRVPGPGRSPREPCPDYMRRRKRTKAGSLRAVLGGSRTSFRDASSSSLNFRVCF